jgi:hypothetical protein
VRSDCIGDPFIIGRNNHRETNRARDALFTTCIIIGNPAMRRRGLPGNLVEEYRAGMIATASPFTGLQPNVKVRTLSNGGDKLNSARFDKAPWVPYGCSGPSLAKLSSQRFRDPPDHLK